MAVNLRIVKDGRHFDPWTRSERLHTLSFLPTLNSNDSSVSSSEFRVGAGAGGFSFAQVFRLPTLLYEV